MPFTIERLRRWVLAAAALLIVVVLGFIFYGRYRFRHIARDLPARLGVNIQQTATGFSYSQSSQGHTLFTLKASKEFQLKSGHVLLHNVDITLYGPPGSSRTDHITGSDFDYNQQQGIAISHGEVDIELEGMGSSAVPGPGSAAAKPPSAQNTISVQTSGLTFVQKTGEASTANPVHFQFPRASGSSVGADYNSKTGVLVLSSQVGIDTSTSGKPAHIGAAHATVLRGQQQALLTAATLAYSTETASADQATVWFRKDGSAEKVDAQGHVHLATQSGAAASSQTAHILLNPKSQPTQADLGGGVLFASARDGASMHGSAQEATLVFAPVGAQTQLRHAQFRRNVAFVEEVAGLARDPHARAEKHLNAGLLNVAFAPAPPGQPVEARTAMADGSPVLTLLQAPSKGPQQTDRITADHLVADLGPGNAIRKLDGAGNTEIRSESSDGAHSTSRGDVLHATFIQQPAPQSARKTTPIPAVRRKPGPPPAQTVLDTAVQDGHVVFAETPARHPGAAAEPQPLTGSADHAEYHAASQLLVLTGHPRIRQGASTDVAADRIEYHRDSQDAAAQGNVKAAYLQQPQSAAHAAAPSLGGNGPVFVIADRADFHHAGNQTFFYGTEAAPARLWQGQNSLLAPVIELDRAQDQLKASAPGSSVPLVDANFTSTTGAGHQPTLVRVHSDMLVYSDRTRQADFRGSVTAANGDQNIHADDALVFLKPAAQPKATPAAKNAAAGQNSQIDHVIATGHVVFTQPGRHGEGAKLVYTAADGRYVLTGAPGAPPRLTDRVHGTTSGAALIFNTRNDSVIVSGGPSSAITVTHTPR